MNILHRSRWIIIATQFGRANFKSMLCHWICVLSLINCFFILILKVSKLTLKKSRWILSLRCQYRFDIELLPTLRPLNLAILKYLCRNYYIQWNKHIKHTHLVAKCTSYEVTVKILIILNKFYFDMQANLSKEILIVFQFSNRLD